MCGKNMRILNALRDLRRPERHVERYRTMTEHVGRLGKISGLAMSALILIMMTGSAQAKPNILAFIADDFGYGDPSFNGGTLPTPSFDELAEGG